MIWWAVALSAVLLAPVAVLLAGKLDDADRTIVGLSALFGVLASVVQFLGLIRWPFLVPYLSRVAVDAEPGSARDEAVDVVFQATVISALPSVNTSGTRLPGFGRSSPGWR